MSECPACAGPTEGLAMCSDCARVRGDEDALRRASAWALAALHRHQRHPGLAPFVLWDGGTAPGCERVAAGGLEGVARAHDLVRVREPLHAFAYLSRGFIRSQDASFDPVFGGRPGARPGTVVIAGVQGQPLALLVGQPDDAPNPTLFTRVPSWLGKGPRQPTKEPTAGALTVGVRLKQ